MNPSNPPSLLSLAQGAHDAGRFRDAEALCRQILAKEPKNLDATVLLGVLFAKTGQVGPGIQLMRSALATNPQCFDAHYWLGVMALSAGDTVAAVRHGTSAVELKPGDAQAHYSLGRAYLAQKNGAPAIASFRYAITLEPGVGLLHHGLGDALRLAGQDGDAADAYRQAIALSPDQPKGYVALAAVLRRLGQVDESNNVVIKAFEKTPFDAAKQMQLARALIEAGMTEEAVPSLHKAIELEPGLADAYATMGHVLQQLGKFGGAAASLRKAIELQPRSARPYLDLTGCRRMTDADRPLIDQMTAMLQNRAQTPESRCYLHYALGKAYNDLAEYGRAMRHYDEANGIMRMFLAGKAFDRRECTVNVDQAIRTITSEYIQRHRELNNPSDLPILIVGMIRSGTTLVEQIVSSHSEVAAGGEQNYLLKRWSRILQPAKGAPHTAEAHRIAEGYLELLRSIGPNKKHVTDKMPNNFLLLGLAHLLFPNARLIHCRRHPVDTCLSIYTTFFQEPVNIAHDPETIVFFYREYQRLMEHWRQVLPADRFLEVDYEALVADRETVTRRIINFCGLSWEDACLHHERNEGAISTPSWWQARQPVYATSVGRWRNYEPWLGEFKSLLP